MTLGINLTAAAGLPSLAPSRTAPRSASLSASGAAQVTTTPATVAGSAETAALPRQRKPLDPDTPTGPPPTFAATVLELDANLQLTLARLNTAGYGKLPGVVPAASQATAANVPAQTAPKPVQTAAAAPVPATQAKPASPAKP